MKTFEHGIYGDLYNFFYFLFRFKTKLSKRIIQLMTVCNSGKIIT